MSTIVFCAEQLSQIESTLFATTAQRTVIKVALSTNLIQSFSHFDNLFWDANVCAILAMLNKIRPHNVVAVAKMGHSGSFAFYFCWGVAGAPANAALYTT